MSVPLRASEIVLGESICHAGHDRSAHGGPLGRYCIAFPRRALWIQPEHHAEFFADSTTVTCYGPHDEFERRAIDPAGGHAEWIAFPEAAIRDVLATVSCADAARSEVRFPRPCAGVSMPMYVMQRRLCRHAGGDSPDLLFL